MAIFFTLSFLQTIGGALIRDITVELSMDNFLSFFYADGWFFLYLVGFPTKNRTRKKIEISTARNKWKLSTTFERPSHAIISRYYYNSTMFYTHH